MKSPSRGLFVACCAICAALMSIDALAQSEEGNAYAELGFTQLHLSSGGISLTPSDAVIRVGYNFTKNFSAEIIGATSVSSDTLMGASFKVDTAYGAYFKGQVEVASHFEVFAKAGWVHATLTGSAPGISLSSSDSSFSYAAGAQYRFKKNWYLQGDYASYYDKSGDTITGPSISIGYRF